ncbi:MAG: winged helix-turn-helix domain-containing protein [Nitrososphaerales archaeon]
MQIPIRKARRDELTIMMDILEYLLEPRRVTHILYRSNLSYTALRKYLMSLTKLGFIEEVGDTYRSFCITENGRAFLRLVRKDGAPIIVKM